MEATLGKRIAALRRDKGLKQDDLAQQLGVTPQAVSRKARERFSRLISRFILSVSVFPWSRTAGPARGRAEKMHNST